MSHQLSCFESVYMVIVKSLQVSQVYLEFIRTSVSFDMVARPLEFLSSVKLRPPPLEVRRVSRNSFPDEARKWTPLSWM